MSDRKDELERLLGLSAEKMGYTRKAMLGDLTERERAVLELRFGLDLTDVEENWAETQEKNPGHRETRPRQAQAPEVVLEQGFEPRFPEPKSGVLPLDDSRMGGEVGFEPTTDGFRDRRSTRIELLPYMHMSRPPGEQCALIPGLGLLQCGEGDLHRLAVVALLPDEVKSVY